MYLEKPIIINHTELKNRIVMPPMASAKSSESGLMTDELTAYYTERAENTGLIITEHSYVMPEGRASERQVSVCSDEAVSGLAGLARALHQAGTKAIVQINHAGAAAKPADPSCHTKAPSAVQRPGRVNEAVPEEMTKEDIEAVVSAFAAAALRVKKAGFDGVEIHSAHGYLLNQFYSPLTNLRRDEYGGTLENRMRIHREILRAVREKTGDEFLISVRLGGIDYIEGGSTSDDAVRASRILAACGADMISLTGGMKGYVNPDDDSPGYFRDMSVPVKKAVSVPVLLTGGIHTAQEAEQLLAEGAADLIGIGREMLKNPRWAKEAAE